MQMATFKAATGTGTSVYADVAYAPYGEAYAQSGASDLSFTGQNNDTVSNLYDFLLREYHPVQGRWISPDPAGVAAVDPMNPQTWNRYAYVGGDPLSNVDPLGLGSSDGQCTENPDGTITCPDAGGSTTVYGDLQTLQPWLVTTNFGCMWYGTCNIPQQPGGSGPGTGGGGSGTGGGGGQSSAGSNTNTAKSVTRQCLASYNGSIATKSIQLFSLYHLATNFWNALPEWTIVPGGKILFVKTASSLSKQIGNTEFLSVTSTSDTVIPSATSAVVDLAETAGKAGATPAIVVGTGVDVLAKVGCDAAGRQAAGQITPLPPGWESSF